MYDEWRGRLYPPDQPKSRWFAHLLAEFGTVEVNASFYRLPSRETFASWREQSPPGALLAVKMSRYLTHVKRLHDPREPVSRFLEVAAGLGDRLGPVLLQLPPNLQADPAALEATLSRFPVDVRIAVEPRHPSWWTAEVEAVLKAHQAALVWADRGGKPVTPLWRTASFGYVRFHEGPTRSWPAYGRRSLATWAGQIRDEFGPGDDVFVYFNNDMQGAAIDNARTFTRLVDS
jgi:uncharacterized protein YecE (DUF72 family)